MREKMADSSKGAMWQAKFKNTKNINIYTFELFVPG